MSNKNGRGKAKGKNKGKKSGKAPAVALPAIFPFFPIGSFLLPLLIPVPSPPKPPEK